MAGTSRKSGDHDRQDPPPQVLPAIQAWDARALIRFLVDAFGFEETVVYGEGDRVDHAELARPIERLKTLLILCLASLCTGYAGFCARIYTVLRP